ncbi:MAG: hypothetical protein QXU42_07445 [Thermoproteota archaeon]
MGFIHNYPNILPGIRYRRSFINLYNLRFNIFYIAGVSKSRLHWNEPFTWMEAEVDDLKLIYKLGYDKESESATYQRARNRFSQRLIVFPVFPFFFPARLK